MHEIVTQPDQLDELRDDRRVPALVIVGDQDHAVPRALAEIVAAVPGARLVVIPDAGHSPQFENPVGVARRVLEDFLASL